MNGLTASLSEIALIAEAAAAHSQRLDTLICPPATLLAAASVKTAGTSLAIGAQDCSGETHGAYTGDVSVAMVADSGGRAVIVGHSERRQGRSETDADVKRKAERVIEAGLQVIICIGETEEEMLNGVTQDVLLRQLHESVPAAATSASVVIAYEPVWAIGTGRTPSIENIAGLHGFIRASLIDLLGEEGKSMRILYGGSVKPDNAAEIARIDHVNGALVGGASLKCSDFLSIVNAF